MSLDGDALGGVFAEMQRLQEQLVAAQAEADEREVLGNAGGGAVRIRASGEFSFTSVEIDPAVLEAGDVSVLEDLVLAALRDASTQLNKARREAMGTAVSAALGSLFADSLGADEDSEPELPRDS